MVQILFPGPAPFRARIEMQIVAHKVERVAGKLDLQNDELYHY